MTRDRRHAGIGRIALLALLGTLIVGTSAQFHGASAQSLEEALVLAYQNNPSLQAQRARLRAVDEEVPEALAGWRPSIEIAGDVGALYSNTEGMIPNSGSSTVAPHGVGLSAVTPIYQGGRVAAQIESAENRVGAGRAQLREAEQSILLGSVLAYMDVLRYSAEIELSRSSERVVRRQLRAAQDRLEVGEVTRTDVAQAEARLAQAGAERVMAEGGMMSARAAYRQVIGEPPGTPSWPPVPMGLPETEEDALAAAAEGNPAIEAASFIARASEADIEAAAAALRPQVSIVGDVRQRFDSSDLIESSADASLMATLRMPLYQGGAANARIRQSKQIAAQRRPRARSGPAHGAGAGCQRLAGTHVSTGADRRIRIPGVGGGGRAGRCGAGDTRGSAHDTRRSGRRTGAFHGADQPGPGAAGRDRRRLSVEGGDRRSDGARTRAPGGPLRSGGALSERARQSGRVAMVGRVTATDAAKE